MTEIIEAMKVVKAAATVAEVAAAVVVALVTGATA